MKKLRIGIEGGAGFTGGELIRLLLSHPKVEIAAATSSTFPGQPVFLAHPNLRGRTDLTFSPMESLEHVDVLFLCTPHGVTMGKIDQFLAKANV